MSDSTMTIDEWGTKLWKNSAGQYHREDGPAIEYSDGAKAWYVNGKRHRSGGPAIEWSNGDKEWWVNGKRHRTDGPAIERVNGRKLWYVNGWFLGYNEEGFWALWERLTPEQKKDPTLLSYLPGEILNV